MNKRDIIIPVIMSAFLVACGSDKPDPEVAKVLDHVLAQDDPNRYLRKSFPTPDGSDMVAIYNFHGGLTDDYVPQICLMYGLRSNENENYCITP